MNQFSTICNFIWIWVLVSANETIKNRLLETQVNSTDFFTCTTSACNDTALRILGNMNKTVDLCDNFYQFACGRFASRFTNLSDERMANTLYDELKNTISLQLKTVIEGSIHSNESNAIRYAKQLYNICMNTTAIENQGLRGMLSILKKMGGWPVVDGDQWNGSNFDWKKSIYKLRDFGYIVNYFIDLTVSEDMKNNSKYAIYIGQPHFKTLHKYLVKGRNDTNVDAYYNFMIDVAVMLGANRERAKKELGQSLNFEIRLATISLSSEQQHDEMMMYNTITIGDLSKNYTHIPWREYINRLLPRDLIVEDDEVVIVDSPEFLLHFGNLISTTSNRTLANYALWKATADSILYLNEKIRQRQFTYSSPLNGIRANKSRWSECLEIVSESLGVAVGSLYVRNYVHKKTMSEVGEMIDRIKKQFMTIIKEQVRWMNKKTRKNAVDKIAAISAQIAYPNELLNDKILDEYYKDLKMDNENFLTSILNINRHNIDHSLNLLRKSVHETSWMNDAYVVDPNAYYYPIKNKLQISASLLQDKLFHKDHPKYLNYGAMGSIIGHELIHALDDIGSQHDKYGNLVDWWNATTMKIFKKKIACIIEQYSNYIAKDVKMKLNGVGDQSENIADNGGVKIAYLAYVDWLKNNGKVDLQLPGISYSPKQMFWIAAANNLCSAHQLINLKHLIVASVHSLEEFRIIGSFSNMPEFSKDFGCPVGSTMNPIDKCTVW